MTKRNAILTLTFCASLAGGAGVYSAASNGAPPKALAEVRAYHRARVPMDVLPATLRAARTPVGVRRSDSRRVLAASTGTPALYVAPSADGLGICLFAQDPVGSAVGCVRQATFSRLGFIAMLKGEPADPQGLQILGVADSRVARVDAVYASGSLPAAVTPSGAFILQVRGRSERPSALRALDAHGDEIGSLRLPTE